MPFRYDLRCPACTAVVSCGSAEMAARLRKIGKLRRAAEPEPEVLVELFLASASQFRCEKCGTQGLTAAPARDDDGDWGSSLLCQVCRKPIPAERVSLLPDARTCAACAGLAESGIDQADAEYCPKCGSIMTLRQSRAGGVTRYVMSCLECRR